MTISEFVWITLSPLLGVIVGASLTYWLQRRQLVNALKLDLVKRLAMNFCTIRTRDGKFTSNEPVDNLIKLLSEIEITYLYVKNHKRILSAVGDVRDALHADKIEARKLNEIDPIHHLNVSVATLLNVMMKDLGAK